MTYQDRIAAFGPRLTGEGLFGYIVSVEMIEDDNQKGCSKLKKDVSTKNWIALVERGQCTFIEKVRNMQASGAIAVVVGDNEKNGLITMYATGELSRMICIYLFFIMLIIIAGYFYFGLFRNFLSITILFFL